MGRLRPQSKSGNREQGNRELFYNHKAFVGIGFTPEEVKTFEYAEELTWARSKAKTSSVRIRLTNDDNVVTWRYSHDEGRTWTLHSLRMEVSGIHQNVFGAFSASGSASTAPVREKSG